MVKRLKLKNFRGVKNGEIELGDLTIFVGSNNAAKTTILEALFLLPNPLRYVPYFDLRGDFTAALLIHEIHKTLDSQGYTFLLNKYIADEAEIEGDNNYLKFVKNDYGIFMSTNSNSNFKTSILTTQKGDFDYFGKLEPSSEGSELTTSDNRNKLITPDSLLITPEFSKFAYSYIHRNWGNIMNLGIMKEVAKDISRIVNEKYINITIEPFMGGRLSIFGFLEDGSRIRLGDLGSGVQIYLISRVLYELKKPKILLWDDFEAHLNPRMLIRISEWFSEIIENDRVQIVVSTHSLEAVRILAEFNKNAVIYLTSLDDGILEKRKLSIEEIDNLLSAGIDVRLADSMIL
jgi:predicted ATPase